MIQNVTIGTDPEAFLFDGKQYISSIGLIGGSKEEPRNLQNGIAVQEDNVAVEFNTPPARTYDEFLQAVQDGIAQVSKLTPHKLVFTPKAVFLDEQLADPKAKEIGCDPDYSVYGGACTMTEYVGNERFAAGHIHVGYDEPSMIKSEELAILMDLFVGIPSVMEDIKTNRRDFYGKAGSIRIKPYGVEYRVLSNYWLNYPETIQKVYERTMRAVQAFNDGFEIQPEDYPLMIEAINTHDQTIAQTLIEKYELQ